MESIVSLFQTVFDEIGRDKMEKSAELIQLSRVQNKKSKVKIKGEDFIIPAGKIVQINCKTNVGLIFQQRDVELPVGIHCADSVVPAST